MAARALVPLVDARQCLLPPSSSDSSTPGFAMQQAARCHASWQVVWGIAVSFLCGACELVCCTYRADEIVCRVTQRTASGSRSEPPVASGISSSGSGQEAADDRLFVGVSPCCCGTPPPRSGPIACWALAVRYVRGLQCVQRVARGVYLAVACLNLIARRRFPDRDCAPCAGRPEGQRSTLEPNARGAPRQPQAGEVVWGWIAGYLACATALAGSAGTLDCRRRCLCLARIARCLRSEPDIVELPEGISALQLLVGPCKVPRRAPLSIPRAWTRA